MKIKNSVLGREVKCRGLYKKKTITKSRLILEKKHKIDRPAAHPGPHPGHPKNSKEHEAFAKRMQGDTEREYSMLDPCHIRPQKLCSLRGQRFPEFIYKTMKEGVVMCCQLHEILVRMAVNKGEKYNLPS